MRAEPLVSRILDDDKLTNGLDDPEARVLVEWLVRRAEEIARTAESAAVAHERLETLCKRVRAIRRFVSLWYHTGDRGAALQLVGAERFHWPLPEADCDDPYTFLNQVLALEQSSRAA
jgi:hypothetical protein